MAIHELERACGRCEGTGSPEVQGVYGRVGWKFYCPDCAGRGRMGVGSVRISTVGVDVPSEIHEPGWYYFADDCTEGCSVCDGHGPFPTQDEALAAALEAMGDACAQCNGTLDKAGVCYACEGGQ